MGNGEPEAVEAQPSLEGQSTRDLLFTLQVADSVKAELLARGGAFLQDVLSKVEGFPSDLELRECTVHISPADEGQGQLALCVRIPVHMVGAGLDVMDAHNLKLALKGECEKTPGVACVEIGSTMISGVTTLVVVLDPNHVSGPGEHVQADGPAAGEEPVPGGDPSEAVRRQLAVEAVASATTAAVGGRRQLAAEVLAVTATAAAKAGRGGVA